MRALLSKDDPILREPSQAIAHTDITTPWVQELAEQLLQIMADKGAVGIAAPQIGITQRLIAFSTAYTQSRKPEVQIPDTVLINPSWTQHSETCYSDYEGCLNCGELMGQVPRYQAIHYQGYDINGHFIEKQASGLEARIVQHEVDHLNGLLFIDRVGDQSNLTTRSELLQKAQS